MTSPFRSSGNARHWQFRESDHRSDAGLRRHHHGPLLPMQPEPRRWPIIAAIIAIWLGSVCLGLFAVLRLAGGM